MGAQEMTSLSGFSAFAASRGEGLHPKLRDLLERAATFPFSEVGVRHDGMLQAGPTPKSEKLGSPSSVILFLHGRRERA
jgi:hypothetical protein